MNKLILVLSLVMFGCTTSQPTRTVLNCQADYIVGNGVLFLGGSRINNEITCKTIQIPAAPKAIPLQVNPDLVK